MKSPVKISAHSFEVAWVWENYLLAEVASSSFVEEEETAATLIVRSEE